MWLFVSQVGLPGASGTDEPHVARSEPCVALCEPCVALCEPGGASGTDEPQIFLQCRHGLHDHMKNEVIARNINQF